MGGGTERDRQPLSVTLPPGRSTTDPLAAPDAQIERLWLRLELRAFVRNVHTDF